MTNGAKLNRVLLKLSGEVLSSGASGMSIDPEMLKAISEELAEVHASGCQIGIVIGGGNIVRGAIASKGGMDRVQAGYMGMLGLDRRAKVYNLTDYVVEQYGDGSEAGQ